MSPFTCDPPLTGLSSAVCDCSPFCWLEPKPALFRKVPSAAFLTWVDGDSSCIGGTGFVTTSPQLSSLIGLQSLLDWAVTFQMVFHGASFNPRTTFEVARLVGSVSENKTERCRDGGSRVGTPAASSAPARKNTLVKSPVNTPITIFEFTKPTYRRSL